MAQCSGAMMCLLVAWGLLNASGFVQAEPGADFVIEIERTHQTIQGRGVTIDVVLKSAPLIPSGFDITIAYPRQALDFRWAKPGSFLTDCRWRHFDYRTREPVDTYSDTSVGVLQVTGGLGHLNTGSMFGPDICNRITDTSLAVLFSLDFWVTPDRTLEGACVPLSLYWTGCDDNAVFFPTDSNGTRVELKAYVDSAVEPPCYLRARDRGYSEMPSEEGVLDSCRQSITRDPQHQVIGAVYHPGAVNIMGVPIVDDRGDIDLNGTGYEMKDLSLFVDYFGMGKSVFVVNLIGQMHASDVNYDGVLLSSSDLVYLWRKMKGEATPDCELKFDSAVCTVSEGVISVDGPVQAAQVVLQGEASYELLLEGWETLSHFEDSVTRVLVFGTLDNMSHTMSGKFLRVGGEVESIDLSTPEGAWVDVTIDRR